MPLTCRGQRHLMDIFLKRLPAQATIMKTTTEKNSFKVQTPDISVRHY